MKKRTISISLCLMFIFGLISCKKDYTCECVQTLTGAQGTIETTTAIELDEKMSKSDAKEECDKKDENYSDGNGNSINYDCSVK